MSFLTADIILCHLIGDYAIQSDWMATIKTKSSVPALAHALTYSLSFLFLTTSWKVLLFIAGTHFLIDRFRLARYLVWAKNFLAPKWIEWAETAPGGTPGEHTKLFMRRNYPWSDCEATGYYKERPVWLTVWLLIIVDNTAHLCCNAVALRFLIN